MPKILQFKRYANTVVAGITGANGEIIIDSTNKTITVHDGVTVGGKRLATESYVANNSGIGTSPQAAFNQANAATSLAQSAYNFANTIVSDTQVDPVARTTANTASNNITIISGINDNQNTRINSVETINTNQNTSITIIQGVDLTQNTRLDGIEGTNTTQNTRINSIETINTTQNTNITTANNAAWAGFAQANVTVGGLTSANANIALLQGAMTTANANIALLQGAMTTANANIALLLGIQTTQNTWISSNATALLVIQGVDLTQNTNITAAAQTIPQNAQSTNYVLQLNDAGKHIYYTQASNTILYVPTTANVAFSNGATITIISRTTSSANVTVLPNTGVSMYLAGNTTSASRNVTTYGMATLIQVASNTWFINGTGVA